MNIDGSVRIEVADNARDPCWSPDGKAIAYLKGEFNRHTLNFKDYGTKGLFIYDIKTRKHRQHPNKNLHHLYNVCWSPDGNWFVTTVHGGMGHTHALLAIEVGGTKVFDLTKYKVTGCRPDCSLDGKKIAWVSDRDHPLLGVIRDRTLCAGSIDLTSPKPKVTGVRGILTLDGPNAADWSPDGKYIAFEMDNICVVDLTGKWVEITRDGKHNKEPDWMPIQTSER
jgi:Tol biopolymer transport system component